jgi:RNA polymerase sigma-70 factor (ECF subfamily)
MQPYPESRIEAAFTEHRPGLIRYLTWLTHDGEAAQDLAQEAFLRLAREMEAGRTPDRIDAWLRRVGSNLATSQARHAQVVTRHEAALERPFEPRDPETILIGGELAAQVDALVDTLSATERHAVLLAADGACGAEIAQAVGRTEAATRTLLCRARAKLREGMLRAGYATA